MTSSPRWTRPSMRRGRSRDRRPSPVADAPRRRRVDRLRAALLCAVRGTARGAGSRLRPLWVRVVLTTDYLLTLHPERASLPAVLAPELPPGRGPAIRRLFHPRRHARERFRRPRRARADARRAGRDVDRRRLARAPRAALQDTGASLATMRRRVTAERTVFGRLGVDPRPSAGSTPTRSGYSTGSTSRSTTCLRRSTRPPTAWACCSTSSSTSARIW